MVSDQENTPAKRGRMKGERTMKYIVVMYGTTGEYRTEYSSEAKAEKAADNIRGLGYEAEVIKKAAHSPQQTATDTQNHNEPGRHEIL